MLIPSVVQAIALGVLGVPFAYAGYALARLVRPPTEVAICFGVCGAAITALLAPLFGFGALALLALLGVSATAFAVASICHASRGDAAIP